MLAFRSGAAVEAAFAAMPYLRFLRDDRGYEHTYVLHGLRSGSRPSLLYWFRTPSNISVGREPLDGEAIRAIEESHPDLTFDWSKMTRASRPRPAPPAADKGPRTRGRRREAEVGRPPAPEPAVTASTETRASAAPDEPRTPGAAGSSFEAVTRTEEAPKPDAGQAPPDADREAGEAGEHPVAALLGEEALNGLRAQHAGLCQLLEERELEPADQVAIAARLESLDPDAWRAGEEAVVGVERFDREAAAIRRALND